MFATKLAQVDKGLEMGTFATANQLVGDFIKRVTRNGHDIKVFGVGVQPVFFDQAAVGDDGDGL